MLNSLDIKDYQIQLVRLVDGLTAHHRMDTIALTFEQAHEIREIFVNAHLKLGTLVDVRLDSKQNNYNWTYSLYSSTSKAHRQLDEKEYDLINVAMKSLSHEYNPEATVDSYEYLEYEKETICFSQKIISWLQNTGAVTFNPKIERKPPTSSERNKSILGFAVFVLTGIALTIAGAHVIVDGIKNNLTEGIIAGGILILASLMLYILTKRFFKSTKGKIVYSGGKLNVSESFIKQYLTGQPEPVIYKNSSTVRVTEEIFNS